MDKNTGGIGLLGDKGSVYDLAAIYIVLVLKKKPDKNGSASLINALCTALNNGYTYQSIKKDIMKCFYSNTLLPFTKYTKIVNDNLIKQGIRYYHKELSLRNDIPPVQYDIDKGTTSSTDFEFYIEPAASYTMDELIKYFYSKNMADTTEYNYNRMAGIFKYKIESYGLDKVLFMIEAAYRAFEGEHKKFSIQEFDSYSSTASRYLEEIANNCKYSGGEQYVCRKRMLPC